MKERLLEITYREHSENPSLTQREFDCLIALIESGTVTTLQELQEYGFGEGEREGMTDQQMNEALATKVMGWQLDNRYFIGATRHECYLLPAGSRILRSQWNPHENIADAWQLVEKIQEVRWIKIQVGKTTLCLSGKYQGQEDMAEGAETAPRAICKLALKIFA